MNTRIFCFAWVLLLLSNGLLSGQGTFNFSNSADSLIRYQTNGADPDWWSNPQFAPVPVGGGRVEALWAPVGTTDLWDFQPLFPTAQINVVAGRFVSGVRTIPAGSGTTGIAAGGQVSLLLRAWMGTEATFFEAQMMGRLTGYSSIFTIDTGDPTTTPAEPPTAITPAFTGIDMVYIPEPATGAFLVLAGLLGMGKRLVRHG